MFGDRHWNRSGNDSVGLWHGDDHVGASTADHHRHAATASAQRQAVQFTATRDWSAAPVSVTPQAANWAACVQQVSGNTVLQSSTTEVTVSSTGTAQCASGAKGTFTVFAYDPPLGSTGTNCNAIAVCGGGCTISGTAQLTCP